MRVGDLNDLVSMEANLKKHCMFGCIPNLLQMLHVAASMLLFVVLGSMFHQRCPYESYWISAGAVSRHLAVINLLLVLLLTASFDCFLLA